MNSANYKIHDYYTEMLLFYTLTMNCQKEKRKKKKNNKIKSKRIKYKGINLTKEG